MTDLGLQKAIADEISAFLSGKDYQELWGNQLIPLNVYEQDVPLKEPGKGVLDEDEESSDQWNYVCVALGDEDLEDDKWTVTVHIVIGIKDRGHDRQGHKVLCNLMNAIYLDLIKKGILQGHYEMDDTKAHKRFADGLEHPFYQSDLITYWTLPNPRMEGLEGLI